MKFGLLTSLLVLVAVVGTAGVAQAQTNYFFRHPSLVNPPAPPGLDGNWYTEEDNDPLTSGGTNWFDPNLQGNFIPDFSFGAGERAFIENGGTAVINTVGAIFPGQIVMGSAGGTTGTLEIQSGGSIESRIGTGTNGNITVGSTGGTGTLRVLPGGTITAQGPVVEGNNANNLIRVGGLTGATATLSGTALNLASRVQLFPNAAVTATGGANLAITTTITSEITGNGAAGKIDVAASALLNGALVLNFNSYTPSVGHNWNIVEAAALSGNFSSITSNATLATNHALVPSRPSIGGGQVAYNVSLQEVLVLEVNRDNGSATLKHPGSASILMDGYFIGSDAGALVPGNWNSFTEQGLFGGDWIETAPTPSNLGELKIAGDASLAGGNTLNYQFGNVYDALAGPFGQNNEDLELGYRNSDGTQFPGKVVYTGTKVNSLLLQVDPTGAGSAFLRNTSDTTVMIDSYDVLSTAGSLTTAGWNSLDEQNHEGANTWLQVASSANQIGEVNQIGFTQLAPGASLNLGPLFTGGTEDLDFSFLLMGEEDATEGVVIYQALAVVAGDYNNNGKVDLGDYTEWRNHLGQTFQLQNEVAGITPGQVTSADYDAWKARFGNTSGSGAGGGGVGASAVPEPASWLLAVLAGIGWCAISLSRRDIRQ